jgi:hypothetical protein
MSTVCYFVNTTSLPTMPHHLNLHLLQTDHRNHHLHIFLHQSIRIFITILTVVFLCRTVKNYLSYFTNTILASWHSIKFGRFFLKKGPRPRTSSTLLFFLLAASVLCLAALAFQSLTLWTVADSAAESSSRVTCPFGRNRSKLVWPRMKSV